GPSGAAAAVAASPGRMSRSGVGETLGWLPLLGYYALWALADPMFPHFIQRFYSARSDRALLSSMVAYPAIAVLVFLPVCAVGVFGSAMIPGLSGTASDSIFPVLTTALAGPVWGPVFSIAALAALMSTMDSQLLSCASMIATDFLPPRLRGPKASALAAVALAGGAWIVSIRPPSSILDFLGKTAFPGYATLMPVALAAIYAPRLGRFPAAAALAVGTCLVAFESAGLLVSPVPAVLLNLGAQAVAMALASALASGAGRGRPIAGRKPRAGVPARRALSVAAALLAGLMGVDAWNYRAAPTTAFGLPGWMIYHVLLTLSLCGVFRALAADIGKDDVSPPPEGGE
ncbi:MAG: hypothetical protein KKB59_08515, partial [Spirochaetes bacterium]|nr:hypothetical protein [Spirochaetota bacterium]